MKRLIFIFSLLISVGVVASNDYLRTIVVSEFRNLMDPLFESGESTQPQFDAFYTGMIEEFPMQQKAEKALELAINRFMF